MKITQSLALANFNGLRKYNILIFSRSLQHKKSKNTLTFFACVCFLFVFVLDVYLVSIHPIDHCCCCCLQLPPLLWYLFHDPMTFLCGHKKFIHWIKIILMYLLSLIFTKCTWIKTLSLRNERLLYVTNVIQKIYAVDKYNKHWGQMSK